MSSGTELMRASRRAGVKDERVIEALGAIERMAFVPRRLRERAWDDLPVAIPHGFVTPRPSLIARMIEALSLRGHERVLEVGTGLGYETAVLAHLCAEVVSVERFEDLAHEAQRDLELVAIHNVRVIHGDGMNGHADLAPYDAIIVSAAAAEVPEALVQQLADGGTIVIPLGPGGEVEVTAFEKRDGRLVNPVVITRDEFAPLLPGLPEEPFVFA